MPSWRETDDVWLGGFSREPVWLVHELAFGGFLAVTWVRLLAQVGPFAPSSLTYAGLLGTAVGAALAARRLGRPWMGRLRLGLYYPLMLVVFADFGRTIRLIGQDQADARLQAWDTALIGTDLSVALAPHLTPPAVELLSIGYCLFYLYLLGAGLFWLTAPGVLARAFYSGLFTLYAIGLVSYMLLPACGPWAALTGQFAGPPQGYTVTLTLLAAYPAGMDGGGAFPSLHAAITVFVLGFDWLAGYRRRALFCLPVAVLNCAATVSLRFHYLIDVVAGFPLAAFCLALAAVEIAGQQGSRIRLSRPDPRALAWIIHEPSSWPERQRWRPRLESPPGGPSTAPRE